MKIQIMHAAALQSGGVSVRIRISDGERRESRTFVLSEPDLTRMELSVGMELDAERYDELESAAEYFEAMRRGTELLSYGANSRAVLVTKLRRRGYDKELAENVAAQLYERGYINESADAEGIIRACLSRGYGKRRIIMKLRDRGYENKVISEAFRAFEDVDYTANCAEMIRKKCKKMPEERAELDKLIAAMVRYGYSYGEIKGALEICNT